MGLVWAVVLAGPVAWAAGLLALFWLTRPVCEGWSRTPMGWVGFACAVTAAIGLVLAARFGRRRHVADVPSLRFLADIAIWGNAIFLLVIVLSSAPILFLSPCGV